MAKRKKTRARRRRSIPQRMRSGTFGYDPSKRRVVQRSTVKQVKRGYNKARKTIRVVKNPIRRPLNKTLKTKVVSSLPKEVQEINKAFVCAKRKVRKEIMHAIKKTGQGGQKKPKYNKDTHIKC